MKKRYDDVFEAKEALHGLLKKIVFSADIGEVDEEDYTKTVFADIGEGTLSYDPYYQRLEYKEGEIDDVEIVNNLIYELEKRFAEFEKRIKTVREKMAREIFGKPIKGL